MKMQIVSRLKSAINEVPGIIGILYAYRYSSWFFTSVFYLTLYKGSSAGLKLIVILSLLIAAKIVTDIYVKHNKNNSIMEAAILIETFGIALLLIPTAGLSSPFMWYALNPVLVAACFLAPYFCWLNLSLYLLFSTLISYYFYLPSQGLSVLLYDNLYLILVFALITLLVQFFALLTKRLKQQTYLLTYQKEQLEEFNHQLVISNKRYERSIDHIMSLYKISETFNNSTCINKLLQTFTEYASNLTKAKHALIWFCPGETSGKSLTSCFPDTDGIVAKKDYINDIRAGVEALWEELAGVKKTNTFEITLLGKVYRAALIETSSQKYGLIAVSGCKPEDEDQLNKLIVFLAKLCGIVIERRHLEDMADRFLILDEQNRIANEIHDNVSQRLFSIICGIAALTGGRTRDTIPDNVIEQLELIRETSNSAIKELRESIYKLSSKKNGKQDFISSIKSYLDNFSKLNNTQLDINITGDEIYLSSMVRNYLYRIIREATGNAVRHGGCNRLTVAIKITPSKTELIIKDNGVGFDIKKLNKKSVRGLGLYNIRNMIEEMGGELHIKSSPGLGTVVIVLIKLNSDCPGEGETVGEYIYSG